MQKPNKHNKRQRKRFAQALTTTGRSDNGSGHLMHTNMDQELHTSSSNSSMVATAVSAASRRASSASRRMSWQLINSSCSFMAEVLSASDVTFETSKERYASFSVKFGPPTHVLSNLDSDAFLASASAMARSPGGNGIGSFAAASCAEAEKQTHYHTLLSMMETSRKATVSPM